MRVYVGNLPPSINDVKLNELALAYGKPDSANIARLLAGGTSKGFGYIDYVNPDEAYAAIDRIYALPDMARVQYLDRIP